MAIPGKIFYGPLQSTNGKELCGSGALTADCFQPGDGRASEQPGLVAIHTVFVRLHNQIASVLSRYNTYWSEEKVFQETRKIIYSIIQHITYREFLPIVLGPEVMDLFELKLQENDFFNGYDSRVNPAIANSFATAAYRFGHSMVPNSFIRTNTDHVPLNNSKLYLFYYSHDFQLNIFLIFYFTGVPLHEDFDNDSNIWSEGALDRLVLGLCNQMSQRRDEFICEEISNRLFQPKGGFFGIDLTAINIQRGRDHGLPPYTSWRIPCGLKEIKNWQDLEKVKHSFLYL